MFILFHRHCWHPHQQPADRRYKLSIVYYLLFFVFISTSASAQSKRRVRLPKMLNEISGLTRTSDVKLWALNDNGNAPALYQLDSNTGKILEIKLLPIPNRDWEDLTTDANGRLYIGDFGNNNNKRRDLRIYRYDPGSGNIDSIVFAYPDQKQFPPPHQQQWNFDCEAFVWYGDSLHLFSKNRFVGNFYTKHYILPDKPGTYSAILRDSFLLPDRVVTGAALSPDQRILALTAYIVKKKGRILPYTRCSVFFFPTPKASLTLSANDAIRQRLPRFLVARQFESVVHTGTPGRWLAANERYPPFKAVLWCIKQKQFPIIPNF
jgi:hypothetical protein